MIGRIVRALWGDFSNEELKKFSLLSLGFFVLIGSYWPLKILKDAVFINMVGSVYQPSAKILSLVLFFPLVLIFSKLVDHFSKERFIYVMILTYGAIGFLFVALFYHPTIGVANLAQSKFRILGWAFYLFVESYISIMVSLYWAFINDVTTPESAKKGYGLLIFGSQLGAVVFVLLGNFLSRDVAAYASRVPLIALLSVIAFFLLGVVVFILKRVVSAEEMRGYQGKRDFYGVKECEKKESVGFWEGFRLLTSCSYIGGIFGLVFFHEVVSAIMHYQMIRAVEITYLQSLGVVSKGLVNKFFFDFTLVMQSISCLFALFGTSFFQRKIGVKGCLVLYPLLLGICISFYVVNPTLSFITGVMIIAKGINYVLNQPAKEMLYIPATKAVKYKAKAWIDMFGLRSAKMGGSLINESIGLAARTAGALSLVIVSFWILLSRAIGKQHGKVIKSGECIGIKSDD
jgi:AAA family ATP:ADP antiporter